MARKVIDVTPTILIEPDCRGLLTRDKAEEIALDIIELVRRHVLPHAATYPVRSVDVSTHYTEEARCEHCNWTWTEDSPAYNGGCCAKDEANSPVRLEDLKDLAEGMDGEAFYRWDADHGRGRVPIDWPVTLANAASGWLDAGRPVEGVATLLPLIARVRGEEWCTVWEDPGPDGCSLARLPDRVSRDSRPDELAHGLADLIEDMGLAPVKQGATT